MKIIYQRIRHGYTEDNGKPFEITRKCVELYSQYNVPTLCVVHTQTLKHLVTTSH